MGIKPQSHRVHGGRQPKEALSGARIIAYHQQTKHQPNRMARGPGRMDWSNQPNPFRSYDGSRRIALDRLGFEGMTGKLRPSPLISENLSRFFFESLALPGRKAVAGAEWTLRVNPSSGNLHPTECYLLTGGWRGTGSLSRRLSLPAEGSFPGALGWHKRGELAVSSPSIGHHFARPHHHLLARVLEVWSEGLSLLHAGSGACSGCGWRGGILPGLEAVPAGGDGHRRPGQDSMEWAG